MSTDKTTDTKINPKCEPKCVILMDDDSVIPSRTDTVNHMTGKDPGRSYEVRDFPEVSTALSVAPETVGS